MPAYQGIALTPKANGMAPLINRHAFVVVYKVVGVYAGLLCGLKKEFFVIERDAEFL